MDKCQAVASQELLGASPCHSEKRADCALNHTECCPMANCPLRSSRKNMKKLTACSGSITWQQQQQQQESCAKIAGRRQKRRETQQCFRYRGSGHTSFSASPKTSPHHSLMKGSHVALPSDSQYTIHTRSEPDSAGQTPAQPGRVSSCSQGSARRLQSNPEGLGCSYSPRLSQCPPCACSA